jgi:hypothetical protein
MKYIPRTPGQSEAVMETPMQHGGRMASRRYSVIRGLLAALCVVLAIWVSLSVFRAFRATADQISLVPIDKHAPESVSFARQNTERLFQLVVVLLGGLWALAIVDKDHRINAKDAPEIIMFVIATLTLAAFLYFFQHYNKIIEEVYWDIGVLQGRDVDFQHSPYIDLHHRALLRCFYVGLFVSALTAFSLCRLRQDDMR